jgi:hypothetical protein
MGEDSRSMPLAILPLSSVAVSFSPGQLAFAMLHAILLLALIAIAIGQLYYAVAVVKAVFVWSFVLVAICVNIATVSMFLVFAPVAFIHRTIRINAHTSALSDLSSFAPLTSVDSATFVFIRAALLAVLKVDVGGHWVLREVKWTLLYLERLPELVGNEVLP